MFIFSFQNFFEGAKPVFVAFFGFVGFLLLIKWAIKRKNRNYNKLLHQYLEADRQSNFVRKKDIDKIFFYQPDVNSLPIKDYPTEYEKLNKLKDIVIRKSKLQMIKFDSPMDNIEIKNKFGATNLENIIMYEEHFDQYIQALNNWAEELTKSDELIDAEKVLKECIKAGSIVSKTYILLADIYFKKKDKNALINLQDSLKSYNPNSLTKIAIYIDDLLEQLNKNLTKY